MLVGKNKKNRTVVNTTCHGNLSACHRFPRCRPSSQSQSCTEEDSSKHKSTSFDPCRHTYVLSALFGSCCGIIKTVAGTIAYAPVFPSWQGVFTWSQKITAASGIEPSGGRQAVVRWLSGAWKQSDLIASAEGPRRRSRRRRPRLWREGRWEDAGRALWTMPWNLS